MIKVNAELSSLFKSESSTQTEPKSTIEPTIEPTSHGTVFDQYKKYPGREDPFYYYPDREDPLYYYSYHDNFNYHRHPSWLPMMDKPNINLPNASSLSSNCFFLN